MKSTVRPTSFGRVAAALSSIALVAWAVSASADAKQHAGLAGVTVVPGQPANGAPPATLGQGKTITLGDDTGGPSGSTSKLVPPAHTVKKGDTLWDICDTYFGNPWQWPRVWSYNPDILNPHWIYPGEIVRLRKEGTLVPTAGPAGAGAGSAGLGTGSVVLKPKLVPSGTVFLRNQGFIYDSDVESSGEITGSPEDKMLLSALDRVYIRLTDDQAKELGPGDTLTLYKSRRPVKNKEGTTLGSVVQILGTVRVDSVDRDTKLAQGTITESLDVIERGDRVGPVDRRIDTVPPSTNDVEADGHVLATVLENQMFGANQVVLIDKGEKAGLKPGNRLFVVRKGDPWQEGLSSTGAYAASKVTLSTDGAADVKQAEGKQSADYPDEVIAEIRVIRVRKDSATALVTRSVRELEAGDRWKAKKGF